VSRALAHVLRTHRHACRPCIDVAATRPGGSHQATATRPSQRRGQRAGASPNFRTPMAIATAQQMRVRTSGGVEGSLHHRSVCGLLPCRSRFRLRVAAVRRTPQWSMPNAPCALLCSLSCLCLSVCVCPAPVTDRPCVGVWLALRCAALAGWVSQTGRARLRGGGNALKARQSGAGSRGGRGRKGVRQGGTRVGRCVRLSPFNQRSRWVGQCGHSSSQPRPLLESESPPLTTPSRCRTTISDSGKAWQCRTEGMRLFACRVAPCSLRVVHDL
jgi:hypothetical protein